MELHACRNCQMINQIIGNQTQKFSILSEENVILHNLLIKARQSQRELSKELQKLNEALASERERNLQLYLKENIDKVLNKEFASELDTHKAAKASSEHKKQVDDVVQSIECMKLKNIIEEQHTSLHMVHLENERHTMLLNKHIIQAEEHMLVILEFNKSLRDDLFISKKQNVIDREEFLKTVDTLTTANDKYMQDVKRSIVTEMTKTADKITKQAMNSMCYQLNERDKLVVMLRKQQMLLQQQCEQLLKNERVLKDDHKAMKDRLKLRIKNEQDKQVGLEQKRKFDAEGFRSDIKNIHQQLRILSRKLHKLPEGLESNEKCKKLVNDIDNVTSSISNCYITPKVSIF